MYMKRLSEILIFLLLYLLLVMCDFEGSSIYKYDGESSVVGGCVTHRIGKLSVWNPLMYSASIWDPPFLLGLDSKLILKVIMWIIISVALAIAQADCICDFFPIGDFA